MSGLHYAQESRLCAAALPTALLASSAHSDWTSLLLDHVAASGGCDAFETHVTSDVTLVLATRGEHNLQVLKNGHWRRAVYQPGALGMTPAGEATRLRWNARQATQRFQTAHLYLPHQLFLETADHFRRIGHRCREEPLSALLFNDPMVERVIMALLSAMAAGAPDIYAEHAAQHLVTHVLTKHSSWLDSAEDHRGAGVISDARLARTIDFITANFGQALTLECLAAEAGISKFHFAKLFQLRTGSPPYRFLAEVRMNAARRLLLTTSLPVAEIAVECGYPRATTFTAAFTRRFQMPPTACRRGPVGDRRGEDDLSPAPNPPPPSPESRPAAR